MGAAIETEDVPQSAVNCAATRPLSLWPVRYKPQRDELLSSWLVRLAHGMNLKAQTLCNLEFGSQRQIWNRDIDRLGPAWLVETLSQRTGTPPAVAWQTTLRGYEGILFNRFKASGVLPWVLQLKLYHRTFRGRGLMYCPGCLAEDEVCYFRRAWRLAMNTVCLRHRSMLMDGCPACNVGVAFSRADLGHPGLYEFEGLQICHSCGFDLRQAMPAKPSCLDVEAAEWLNDLWANFEALPDDIHTCESLQSLHALCSLFTRRRYALRLADHVCERLLADYLPASTARTAIEARQILERHQMLQMAAWLMVDLTRRLQEAMADGDIRFNHLLRDFRHLPKSYQAAVRQLPHRRTK